MGWRSDLKVLFLGLGWWGLRGGDGLGIFGGLRFGVCGGVWGGWGVMVWSNLEWLFLVYMLGDVKC